MAETEHSAGVTVDRSDRLAGDPLVVRMAKEHGQNVAEFLSSVKANALAVGDPSDEQVRAFLAAADTHGLSPLDGTILGVATRGGVIQAVGLAGGWAKLVNSHTQHDGVQFSEERDCVGDVVATTCHIFLKGQEKPVTAKACMGTWRRDSADWHRSPIRKLRQKSYVLCARAAFGFPGLLDQDEAEELVGGPIPNVPRHDDRFAELKRRVAELFTATRAATPAIEVPEETPDNGGARDELVEPGE